MSNTKYSGVLSPVAKHSYKSALWLEMPNCVRMQTCDGWLNELASRCISKEQFLKKVLLVQPCVHTFLLKETTLRDCPACIDFSLHSSCFRFLLAKREECESSGIRARAWGKKEQKNWLKGNGNDCYAGYIDFCLVAK